MLSNAYQNNRFKKWGRYALLCAVIAVTLLLITACLPPVVSTPDTLCFPQTIGVPGLSSPEPVVDGVMSGDLGWTQSFRYLFVNGTTAPDAIVQGIKDSNFLYMSFEVNLDQTFDNDDAIVLAFSPGGGAANDRRIHIYPIFGGVGASGTVREVDYWNNSATWNTSGTTKVVNPAWLMNNIRVTSANGGTNSWYVEISIPINNVAANADPNLDTGINFPATGTFGLYINVLRVNSTVNPKQVDERHWPSKAPVVKKFLETNTPDPSKWGQGSRGGTNCSGVAVIPSSIYTSNTPASQISLNLPNTFYAKAYNVSVDSSGAFIQANGINATFKIANFGLGNPWTNIPATSGTNPTSPDINIAAATSGPPAAQGVGIMSMGWTLTPAERTIYSTTATIHQCVLVELNSTNPGTVFLNKSAWTNMDFVDTHSPFERQASIGTGGIELPAGRDSHQLMLSEFTYNTDPEAKWDSLLRAEGLKQIGDHEYALSLKPKDSLLVSSLATPPNIEIPNLKIEVPPGTGGKDQKPVVINAQPGNLITVYAEGSISLGGNKETTTGPGGIDLSRENKGDYLLGKQYNSASSAGALIGSWDGFQKSSFLIGPATTLKVPDKVDSLFLAINDTSDGFAKQQGEGFHVQVIQTPFEKYFGQTDSIVTRDPSSPDFSAPLGANLPTYIVCGQQQTNDTLTINGTEYVIAEDIGCYGYIVKSIGQK